MTSKPLADSSRSTPPTPAVLESASSLARAATLDNWLQRAPRGALLWRLDCRPERHGIWAGVEIMIAAVVAELRDSAPELIARHAQEIAMVCPELRDELSYPRSLTDTVDSDERTRNYAADRAYRCLHGLIELCESYDRLLAPAGWWVACDGYDRATGLVQRFFAELNRRRGGALGLQMLLAVDPGNGAAVSARFPAPAGVNDPEPDASVSGRDEPSLDPAQAARRALELEELHERDALPPERLPVLIDAWRQSSTPERALRWELRAMSAFNHAGLYEASADHAASVEAALPELWERDPAMYVKAVILLFFCYVPLERAAQMRPLLEDAHARTDDPADVAYLGYLLAMLYARFLKPGDHGRADALLQGALAAVADADLPADVRHFRTVFLMNGLALVRIRQGRVEEALALCGDGIARLEAHLEADRHQLHRSVLLFNLGQVHAQVGPVERAIEYFTQAMDMDPNYSEYYNDRGALYFACGRLDDAERDYRQAISLSPPYPEVWVNLGQCYRSMGRMADAADAYTRALDLDARHPLAHAGRAEAYLALDEPDAALDDYDAALTLDPDQPEVLASRAILHYDAGRLPRSLADLDAALALAPELADLHQNRAVALAALGRDAEAADALDDYLRLAPDADDRDEVQALRASWLERRCAASPTPL